MCLKETQNLEKRSWAAAYSSENMLLDTMPARNTKVPIELKKPAQIKEVKATRNTKNRYERTLAIRGRQHIRIKLQQRLEFVKPKRKLGYNSRELSEAKEILAYTREQNHQKAALRYKIKYPYPKLVPQRPAIHSPTMHFLRIEAYTHKICIVL